MTRIVPLLATLLFALALGAAFLRPGGDSLASLEISELEFAVLQPDGSALAAHFLVSAEDEHQALQAALRTVHDLYPGATVEEVSHGHDDEADHAGEEQDDHDGLNRVRAQWMPWGWTWEDHELPVPVHYNPNGALDFFTEADVIQALDTWTNVPPARFAFEYAGETSAPASMNVGGPDGLNVIAWQDLGCEIGCVLGITTKSFETHEVDISLNTHPGARLGDGTDGTYDVLTILLHELGHMAGLEHSCPAFGPCTDEELDAIMFHAYQGIRHELGEDDIEGISSLYPAEDGVTSSEPLDPPGDSHDPLPATEEDASIAVQLDAGWNLTVLPGGDPAALANTLSCVDAIYSYDQQDGWAHWIRGLYPSLQTLDLVDAGRPHWVYASESCGAFFR